MGEAREEGEREEGEQAEGGEHGSESSFRARASAAGDTRLPWRLERRLWSRVLRALREADLPDDDERRAARDLYSAYVRSAGLRETESCLAALARYWQE